MKAFRCVAIIYRFMRDAGYQTGWAALIVGVAASCGLSLLFTHHDFAGFDLSPMIDIGWRIVCGQVPGRDFIVTFPPALNLLTAAAFRVFGVTWHALGLTACIVCVALCLLGMRVAWITRLAWGRATAFQLAMVYVASQCLVLVSLNVPWHSSLSEAFAIYAVLTTAALLSLPERKLWLRRELTVHLVLATSVLVLCKPNTAYPAIVLCLLVLYRAGFRRRYLVGVLAVGAGIASALLAVVHNSLWSMAVAYAGLTGRLIPKPLIINIAYAIEVRNGLAEIVIYAVLLFGLKEFVGVLRKSPRELLKQPVELLAIGSVLVGFLGMATNFDLKLTDMPLVLLGMMLFSVTSARATRSQLWTTRNAILFCCFFALYVGRVRLRMQSVGDWAQEGCGPEKVWINDPFLGHMKVCPVVPASLAQMDETTVRVPTGEHVFFGPSLEFMYARDRMQSPEHLPNWWDVGTSFPRSKSGAVVKAWEADRFDVVILVAASEVSLLPAVANDIHRDYDKVSETPEIDVYVRRGESLNPPAARPPPL
jgi:hypothetical protein